MELQDLDIRVAEKMDDYTIIINKGYTDFLTSVMKFVVFEEGREVYDPLTGESLGNIEITKGFYKVHHIQEKMSTLISEQAKRENTLSLNMLLESSISKALSHSVKVGDRVKIINTRY